VPSSSICQLGVEAAPEVENDDQIQALLNGASSEKEEKRSRFLEDPEKTTKVVFY
jgi:hypothetical protein